MAKNDHAAKVLNLMRVFSWLVRAYDEGAQSLREAAEMLDGWQQAGRYPENMPVSRSALSDVVRAVEEYFSRKHPPVCGCSCLFVHKRHGERFAKLNTRGHDVAELAQRILDACDALL